MSCWKNCFKQYSSADHQTIKLYLFVNDLYLCDYNVTAVQVIVTTDLM